MTSISYSVPLLPPLAQPVSVGAVTAVTPVAFAAAEAGPLPLPVSQALAPAPAPAAAAAGAAPDPAAMRPDQVIMARQMHFQAADGATLASSWRTMVRNYGNQVLNRELRMHAGQLPAAVLIAGQDGRVLRQPEQPPFHPDAWRFTVHAGGPQAQQLRVIADDADQPPGRRRRPRAALRLELKLVDGTRVVVQVEPMPGGVALTLCAPDAQALERLRELQPALEQAVQRSGLQVLRWNFRDRLPVGQAHAQLASSQAESVLTLPVFRAVAELALSLPAQDAARVK